VLKQSRTRDGSALDEDLTAFNAHGNTWQNEENRKREDTDLADGIPQKWPTGKHVGTENSLSRQPSFCY
jgi:hypothetical protein